MDNKYTKERINNHLSYDWYKYIIVILIAVVGWIILFALTTPGIPESEIINVYIFSPEASQEEIDKLQDYLEYRFEQEYNSESRIKQLNVVWNSSSAVDSAQKMVNLLSGRNGDILIMPYFEDEVYLNMYIQNFSDMFADLSQCFEEGQPLEYVVNGEGSGRYVSAYNAEYTISDENGEVIKNLTCGLDLKNCGSLGKVIGTAGKCETMDFAMVLFSYAGYNDEIANFIDNNAENFAVMRWITDYYE